MPIFILVLSLGLDWMFILFRLLVFLGLYIVIAWRKNFGVIHFMNVNRRVAFLVLSVPNQSTWILGAVHASIAVLI